MAGWCNIHVGYEGDDVEINGLKLWQQEWRLTKRDLVELPRPHCPLEQHYFHIYEVGDVDRPVCFAATELSPSVWCFYVPN